MIEYLFKDNALILWIINILLTVISLLGSFLLWYIITLIKKASDVDDKLKQEKKKNETFRHTTGTNLSSILSSQISFGNELSKIRGALDSNTVVLRRRKEETDKIMEESKRTNNRVDEINRSLDKTLTLVKTHNTEIIKLKGGKLLIKGNKDD